MLEEHDVPSPGRTLLHRRTQSRVRWIGCSGRDDAREERAPMAAGKRGTAAPRVGEEAPRQRTPREREARDERDERLGLIGSKRRRGCPPGRGPLRNSGD
jgi:hypothetical protein